MTPPPRTPRLHFVSALALGALSVAAFAPLGMFPLILVTLAGLFALLDARAADESPARQGAMLGACFGLGFFLTGVSWVFVSLSTFGGMPAPLAAIATFLFCVVLTLYPALAGALYVRLAPSLWWQKSLVFAAAWTLAEWLRGWVLTGFPWLAVGYAQTPPSPLAGFAPLFGVYGLSFLTALCAVPLAISAKRLRAGASCSTGKLPCPLLPLLLPLLLVATGVNLRQVEWTAPTGTPLRVALLQGNIPQELKWRPDLFYDSLRTYYRLALENPAELTVLPETAIPAFLDQLPAAYLADLQRLAERERGNLLLGIATGGGNEYANSALSIGVAGMQRYDKTHLVPFGEFVPPGFRWVMRLVNIPMSDFTPGADRQAPIVVDGQRIAINICYEDAFGEEIIRALPEATVLINLSNVAWFGDSLAPAQHLQISRLRALETGRMMLRSTNTGMTAAINADGTLAATLPPFTRGALRHEVQGREGTTPFVRWGNVPVVLAAIAVLLMAFARRRKALP